MIETVKEHCVHKDCKYRCNIARQTICCVYILKEHKPRGCGISDCDKYKTNGRRSDERD